MNSNVRLKQNITDFNKIIAIVNLVGYNVDTRTCVSLLNGSANEFAKEYGVVLFKRYLKCICAGCKKGDHLWELNLRCYERLLV